MKPLIALLSLLVALATPAPAQFGSGLDQQFGLPDASGPTGVSVSAIGSTSQVPPGGRLVAGIVLDHADGWKTWPARELDLLPADVAQFAIHTDIQLTNAPGWISGIGAIQWPDTKESANPLFEPPTVQVFKGRVLAYVPVQLSADAPVGTHALTFSVTTQSCDDETCLMPETAEVEILFAISEDATIGIPSDGDFANFDPAGFDSLAAPSETNADAPVGSSFFGLSLGGLSGPGGLIILALLSALGGLVLNLTPCVLPVIPIKVMTLTTHAGSPGKALLLGLWMALGVIAFWAGLGVVAASFTELADPSRIFGIWWFTFAVGAIITALGVGSMGAFSINLPQSVYKVNPKADTPHGSFLFGVMTAILGLPCFGFVAGALLPIAASLGPVITMLVFVSLGVGMALPYLILSAKPSLVESVPRTGPASELVKQVMGLLLVAAGMYFLGSGVLALFSSNATVLPWWGKVVHWWLVALAALAAGGWLIWQTLKITKKPLPRLSMAVVGLVFASGGVYASVDSTIEARNNFWNPYSEESFTQALDDGRVIVVDFTAEWCLNCKALKKAVLNRNPVKPELLSDQVVPITADLTSSSAPGWDFLREIGQTGIPTLAVFGPGLERPWVANAYTSQQVLDAIARARG